MAINKANAGWWGLPLAVASIVAVATIASLFLASLGWPIFPQAKAEEKKPEPTPEIVSQWEVSPAMVKLKESLEAPPAGWEGTGTLLTSPQTPYPFSCTADGVNPVISLAKNFNAAGTSIQVMTTAYSAGLGAKGMKTKFDRSYDCAKGDANYGLSPLQGPGAEAYQATVSKPGLNTRTIIWRYGDIVVYLIADGGNGNAAALASAFNDNMIAKLGGVCVAENYEDADVNRNPFSGNEYKGFYVGKKVTIDKLELPKVPSSAAYVPTPIPAPEVTVPEIEVPLEPTEYPVWPKLPAPMQKPTAPTAPAKESPHEKNVQIKADDTTGPGCGWAFTGSTSPSFDANEADVFNKSAEAKATEELAASAKKWQEDVLKYWEDYASFKEQLPKWDSYAKQVETVRAAWAKIETDWANYREAKAVYDAQVKDRDDFLARQKAAQASYDSLIKQCEAQTQTDAVKAEEARKKAEEDRKKAEAERKRLEEEKKNNPTASPSPTPTQTPSPEPTQDAPRVQCPAERPIILDETAPEVGKAPTPPADPRPVSERK
jgi:hypothetical protein